jgi:LPP20 lipoprotein
MKNLMWPLIAIFAAVIALSAFPVWAKKAPEWVEGTSKRYPSPEYFIGVGTARIGKGSTKQQHTWAADRARAEIAKTIRTEIKVVTRSSRDVKARPSKRGAGVSAVDTQSDAVVAMAGEVLEGVEIKKYYKDKKDGMFYALAVLDRMKTARMLSKRSERLRAMVADEMDAASGYQSEGRTLLSIHHYRLALGSAEELTSLRELINIVKPGPPIYEEIGSYEAKLNKIIDGLKKQVRFTVEVTGPAAGVRSYVIQGLAKDGFVTSSAAKGGVKSYKIVGTSDLLYKGEINMGENMKMQIYQAELDLEIHDPDTNEVVGTIDWQVSANEKTAMAAEKSAIRALGRLVKKQISERIADIM